jgi:dTDP-4-dehydrorhamnose 3,5-epimerase
MDVRKTPLPGVLVVAPRIFTDARGSFHESWHRARYADSGAPAEFVQDNVSRSGRGTLRGLHYQHPHAQGKLVSVLLGEVFDVAVDIRRGSPTFGESFSILLSAANGLQLYIPPGFAHGFLVTSDEAIFHYKCTEQYHAAYDRGIRWNDPALGIDWPDMAPLLSEKDASAPLLADVPRELLPD